MDWGFRTCQGQLVNSTLHRALTSQTCSQSIIGLIFGQTACIVFRKYTIGELTQSQQCFVAPFLCISPNYSSHSKRFHALFDRNSTLECFACSGQHLFLDCVWSLLKRSEENVLNLWQIQLNFQNPGKISSLFTAIFKSRKGALGKSFTSPQNIKITVFSHRFVEEEKMKLLGNVCQ